MKHLLVVTLVLSSMMLPAQERQRRKVDLTAQERQRRKADLTACEKLQNKLLAEINAFNSDPVRQKEGIIISGAYCFESASSKMVRGEPERHVPLAPEEARQVRSLSAIADESWKTEHDYEEYLIAKYGFISGWAIDAPLCALTATIRNGEDGYITVEESVANQIYDCPAIRAKRAKR